ncbi:(Fe-S)-binding protein [Paenibacillus sediminis]|nr:(Fe-S)-binding protein [Paenibacillus sediminis]
MINQSEALAERLKLTIDEDQLTNCMRCGFCQNACPTFIETGLEAASPRGRIALMKAVVDGLMYPDQSFQDQMDLCLGCRACEPACPSDVKYGQLIEQTREAIAHERSYSLPVRMARKTFLKGIFPHQGRMRMVGKTLRFYQRSGLQRVVRASGVMKLLPEHLQELEAVMPETSGDGLVERWKSLRLPARSEVTKSGESIFIVPPIGEKVARVGMFRGCIMDVMFIETNVNTVRLLRQAGFEVVIPESQACCGALHAHAGEMAEARTLAELNLHAFADADVDYVASNAGGCGAMLKEYDHLMQDDAAHRELAIQFSNQVKDVSELLSTIGRPLTMQEEIAPKTVTYQDSCHLRNVMRIQGQPRELMRALPGVELCELQGADTCCGSAGIYNMTQPEMSKNVLDRKMEHVKKTDAKYVVTSNPGCLLQMKWGIHRSGLNNEMEAVHLVDLLAEHVRFDAEASGAGK